MLYEVERIKNRRFPTDEVVRRPMYAGRVYKTRGSLTDGHTHKEMALVKKAVTMSYVFATGKLVECNREGECFSAP